MNKFNIYIFFGKKIKMKKYYYFYFQSPLLLYKK